MYFIHNTCTGSAFGCASGGGAQLFAQAWPWVCDKGNGCNGCVVLYNIHIYIICIIDRISESLRIKYSTFGYDKHVRPRYFHLSVSSEFPRGLCHCRAPVNLHCVAVWQGDFWRFKVNFLQSQAGRTPTQRENSGWPVGSLWIIHKIRPTKITGGDG